MTMTNEDALYELYEALGSQDNPMNAEAARRYMTAIDTLSASTGSARKERRNEYKLRCCIQRCS